MLNLILLPLMKHTVPREELAVNAIKLAQNITDTNKRNACIAATFAFASRFLDETKTEKLLEVLKMADLLTDWANELVEDDRKEIAKNALKEGLAKEIIRRITGLDESIIKQLQTEMSD